MESKVKDVLTVRFKDILLKINLIVLTVSCWRDNRKFENMKPVDFFAWFHILYICAVVHFSEENLRC